MLVAISFGEERLLFEPWEMPESLRERCAAGVRREALSLAASGGRVPRTGCPVKQGDETIGVDLTVRAGEILGIAGVAGNGQSELLEVLGGYREGTGQITLGGTPVPLAGTGSDGRSRRAMGIAHVPEDRQREGLIMDFMAWENTAFGYHDDAGYNRGLLMDNAAIRLPAGRLIA